MNEMGRVFSSVFVRVAGMRNEGARQVNRGRRLSQAQLNDPFHQFLLAENSERRGDYKVAAAHYRRAIKLYDQEHRFYFGLARTYAQLGNIRQARKALTKARDVSGGASRGIYQAKLDRLERVVAGVE